MFQDIDLRALAEHQGAERAFLTLYLPDQAAANRLEDRANEARSIVAGNADELEHLEHNLELAREVLDQHDFADRGLVVFSAWALDFCAGYPIDAPDLPDLLRVGACFYLRPLAELQDEYERFAAVTATHSGGEIWLVSLPRVDRIERVGAEIKNHVKKGGWSQKRYQRRRREQVADFVDDLIARLETIHREAAFERLVLLGSHDLLARLEEALPSALADCLVGSRQADVKDAEEALRDIGGELADEAERQEEEELWSRIRDDALGQGMAATGPARVLHALQEGRAEVVIVDRELERGAVRCRKCHELAAGTPERCPACGAADPIPDDLLNQLVEQAQLTSARIDFVDPFDELDRLGGVAALLRY